MITVINYGAGNLPNVVRALEHVGATVQITADPQVVREAKVLVLPGVGATRDTMQSLESLGLREVLLQVIAKQRPFLGICVGMQILCAESEEFGLHPCLNSIAGTVRQLPGGQKVPQIGWNQVCYTAQRAKHPLFTNIPDKSDFYFVHSYYCADVDSALIAGQTDYGLPFPSVLLHENLAAVQFHPEKSGHWGLTLLRNFVTLYDHE